MRNLALVLFCFGGNARLLTSFGMTALFQSSDESRSAYLNFLKPFHHPAALNGFTPRRKARKGRKGNKGPSLWPSLRPWRALRLGVKPGRKPAGKFKLYQYLKTHVLDADFELTRLAASLKAVHGLPYADCFAPAPAQSRKAPLLTSDRDFEGIESLVKFVWL